MRDSGAGDPHDTGALTRPTDNYYGIRVYGGQTVALRVPGRITRDRCFVRLSKSSWLSHRHAGCGIRAIEQTGTSNSTKQFHRSLIRSDCLMRPCYRSKLSLSTKRHVQLLNNMTACCPMLRRLHITRTARVGPTYRFLDRSPYASLHNVCNLIGAMPTSAWRMIRSNAG